MRSDPTQQAASAYVLDFVNPAYTRVLTADNCALLRESFASDAWFHQNDNVAAYSASWAVPGCVDAGLDWLVQAIVKSFLIPRPGYCRYRANIRPHCPLSCTVVSCWKQGEGVFRWGFFVQQLRLIILFLL